MIIRNIDTLHVTLIIPVTDPNYITMQDGIRYLDSLNNECRINPGDANEFRFEHKGQLIRMVSLIDTFSAASDGKTKIFLNLLIDRPLKLFKYYTNSSTTIYSGSPGSRPMTQLPKQVLVSCK